MWLAVLSLHVNVLSYEQFLVYVPAYLWFVNVFCPSYSSKICFSLCVYGKMPRSVAKWIHYNFWFVYLVILHTFGVWKCSILSMSN